MIERKILQSIASQYSTPLFVFDTDEFKRQAEWIKALIGNDINLCFSIKANPFLLAALPDVVSYVEVCSPGELTICQNLKVNSNTIIYSGVNKGVEDITRAIEYNVAIITAESMLHIELINKIAISKNKKMKLIIRLSNGNQFGMDPAEIEKVIDNRHNYRGIDIIGLHYYTGTQKKSAQVIAKDIKSFKDFIEKLENEHGFAPSHIEYGPGMAAEYFNPPYDKKDSELLNEVSILLKDFAKKYRLTVEMGRFLASSCGTYLTSVADIKNNCGTSYVICDGGINHLKYYGQTMAMQLPPITVLGSTEEYNTPYTLCGSLCTTADLLVRKADLPELKLGDVLAFSRCGAYTVTEGIGLFLSRTLPRILLYSSTGGAQMVRDFYYSDVLNTPNTEVKA